MRVEREKMPEELRLIEGLRELGKGVGDVDGGGFGAREEIREAKKADGAALCRG